MSPYRVGFVGTGAPPGSSDSTGFAMAYRHAKAYESHEDCELVACADIKRENAEQFADFFDVDGDHVYEDYEKMLATADVDVVSVCVPPELHADLVLGCIRSERVDAVHCEKPMTSTWSDCKAMVAAAQEADVQLTFNHQRRFGEPFRQAKTLLDDGAIGELERLEFTAMNLFDYGSHSFDLCNFFNDEAEPEWVIGQIDYRRKNVVYGAHNENQALVQWGYENGVQGIAATGDGPQTDLVGCHNRIVGSDGVIEIGVGFCCGHGGPTLRVKREGSAEWEVIETDADVHGGKDADGLESEQAFIRPAIRNVISGIDGETPSTLSGEHALRSTQLIFGAWESARRRSRVDLPLDIEDNPLEAMVDAGTLAPATGDD